MAFWNRNKRSDVTGATTSKTSIIPINTVNWTYRSFNGKYAQLDLIAMCIDALARNIGKIELKSIMHKKNTVMVTDTTSDVARVLKQPNPYMTRRYSHTFRT